MLFLLENTHNEHQLAWFSKDWSTVQKLADEYKEEPELASLEALKQITYGKNQVTVPEGYSKFYIDGILSSFGDSVYYAYMSQMFFWELPDQMHFNYMLHAVPQGKKFVKYPKAEGLEELFYTLLIAEYYKINQDDAEMYKLLLRNKGKFDEVIKNLKFLADTVIPKVTKGKAAQNRLRELL